MIFLIYKEKNNFTQWYNFEITKNNNSNNGDSDR